MKKLSKSFRELTLILSALALAMAGTVHGQTLTWDPGATPATGSNGSGTWDNGTTADWSNGASDVTFPTTDTAVVGVAGGSGTYTISVASGGVTAAALTLGASTGTYTFSGGAINLGTATTSILTVDNSDTINSALITKTITFGADNTTLSLGGGSTNILGNGNVTGTSSTIAADSSLDLTGGTYAQSGGQTNINIGNVTTGAGGLVIGTGASYTSGVSFEMGASSVNTNGGVVNVNGGTLTESGTGNIVVGRGATTSKGLLILTSGTMNSTSSGALAVAFANASGEFDVNGGTANVSALLEIIDSSTSAVTGTVKVAGGTLNATGGILFGAGALAGTGTSTAGSGTLTVSSGNLYVGANGIATLGSSAFTSSINLSGGKVGALADWSSSMNMALSNTSGGVTFEADNGAATPVTHNIILSGALSGTGGGFTKTGLGKLTLSNTGNTFSGAVLVSAGELSLASSAGNVEVASGAIFDFATSTAMAASANLVLDSSLTANQVTLNFSDLPTGTDTINSLTVAGQAALTGTYTAGQLDTMFGTSAFTGTGSLDILTAAPEPSTWAFLMLGMGLLFLLQIRRRSSV